MVKNLCLTNSWLKQTSGQEHDQTNHQQLVLHMVEAALDNPQLLMLTPLEIMRVELESVIRHQVKIACGIYSEHADKLNKEFMEHVERFERQIRSASNNNW